MILDNIYYTKIDVCCPEVQLQDGLEDNDDGKSFQ